MNSVQFLDAVRARHGIPSDRKLAEFLDIEQPRVASYRTGRRKLDPDACIAVAKALELPAEHVFAAVQAERAKRTEHRRIWERLAKHAKDMRVPELLLVAGLATSSALAPSPARASTTSAAAQDCIFRQIRRGGGRGRDRRRRVIPVTFDRRRAAA